MEPSLRMRFLLQLGIVAASIAIIALAPKLTRPPRDISSSSVDWVEINSILAWIVFGYANVVVVFRIVSFEAMRVVEWMAYVACVVMSGSALVFGWADLGPVVLLGLVFSLRRFWRLNIRGPVVSPAELTSQAGKICIVTGGNSGIGIEVVRQLALKGALVIIGARDLAKAQLVVEDVKKTTGNGNIIIEPLDLESFASVREFAARINSKFPMIHLLVLNGGIMLPRFQLTKDGHERMLQCNCLSPMLLTALLSAKLRAAPLARVVCTSSCMSTMTAAKNSKAFKFFAKPSPNGFFIFENYGQSKLGLNLFVIELNRRMKQNNDIVCTINACHPGNMFTSITRDLAWVFRHGQHLMRFSLLKTNVQGSASIRFLAMSPKVMKISGRFFEMCAPVDWPSNVAEPELGAKFWNFAQELIGEDLDAAFGWKAKRE